MFERTGWWFAKQFAQLEMKRNMEDFHAGTCEAEALQCQTLMAILQKNSDTEYGRLHNFASVSSPDDYRKTVPICTYDDIGGYIERIKKGEENILFHSGEELKMFAMTSGTTSRPKYIPVTSSYVHDYRSGWMAWNAFACMDHRNLMDRKCLPIFSPKQESQTELGVACGAVTGLTAEEQIFVARKMYGVPVPFYSIKNVREKYYALMRIAIEENIGVVLSANPSTILSVVKSADENRERIIRDVRDGTLTVNDDDVPPEVEEYIQQLKPNPIRSRELERIIRQKHRLYPMDYWPNLLFLACWKGGTVGLYLNRLPQYFGQVPIRDSGLIASEGRMTVPISADGSGGVLDVCRNFYEFIPEDQEDSSNPETLLAHELEEGKRYYIVLTTRAGLYRYNIHDLVEVLSFYNQAPVLRFLNKGKHMSSLTGEKISEFQAISAFVQTAKEFSLDVNTFTFFPCWDDVPYYAVLVENSSIAHVEDKKLFISKLDESLSQANIEYRAKRESNRLGPVRIRLVEDASFERIRDEQIASNGRAEQYKHVYLTPSFDYDKRFSVVGDISLESDQSLFEA